MTEPLSDRNHPHGFDFDYDFWFDCDCGTRITVASPLYERQREGEEPYPQCPCGSIIDISEVVPAVRDPLDIDHQAQAVDRHYWYHSSYLEDWPSEGSYLRDLTGVIGGSPLPRWQHQEMIVGKLSLALHLGTYGAAVESALRRRRDQDFDGRSYWLHQVEISLKTGDLHPEVGGELNGSIGDVSLNELVARDAHAVRYVNTHESAGSISLAVDRSVIISVRTISLPPPSLVMRASTATTEAVEHTLAQLAEAEGLRPDTAGIPDKEIPRSVIGAKLAQLHGEQDPRLMEVAVQQETYDDRQREIWATLEKCLLDEYLVGVNTQVRSLFAAACRLGGDPYEYHEQVRGLSALLRQPRTVIDAFEGSEWRVVGHS
jgi:hypothetical protein